MSKLDQEIDLDKLIGGFFKYFFPTFAIIGMLYCYFTIYNPSKQNYIKKTNFAYQQIQNEVSTLYKEHGKLYTSNEDKNDILCNTLIKKNPKRSGTCLEEDAFSLNKNFVFKGTNITIYGMEKAPNKQEGMLYKDVMIDIDGEKGKNEVGTDRIPIRIYSDGRMGGRITPVNCSLTSLKDWDVPYSPLCNGGPEVNYLETSEPFGFDIIQIGGETGKSKLLGRNLPYFRSDCVAFGGELIAPIEYCDAKLYYWLPACYDEYPCSVDLTGTKL